MLHFPTRPDRIRLLGELGVHALSLDSVKDDRGRRLVENFEAVGWYGVGAAFTEMAKARADFTDPGRPPIHVTCLGAGAVGAHAVRASAAYGDPAVREQMSRNGVPGVEVTMLDFDLTRREDYMLDRLARTDLLIDATNRLDPRVPVVPNRWLAAMPPEAILLDLSSDPYLPDGSSRGSRASRMVISTSGSSCPTTPRGTNRVRRSTRRTAASGSRAARGRASIPLRAWRSTAPRSNR
jgi:alanine dehydrogenase